MKKNTHVLYGLLTALAMIIVGVILYVSGIAFKPWAQYINYIPFLLGLILNGAAFSKANDQDVTFGNVFSSCFKATAIIALISLVWGFLSLAIFPDMVDKAMEMAQENMAKKGMSQEQIDKGLEMTHKYFKVFMAMGIIFGYMFVGAIFSLISAAVTKKNPKPTVQAQ